MFGVGLESNSRNVDSGQSLRQILLKDYYQRPILRLWVYMFMNKISMSQTCMYNFSYKKATSTRFLHQSLQRAFGCSLA